MSVPGDDRPIARPLSFLRTMRAVAWSFLGIRRGSGLEEDVKNLNPVHVIVAGIVATVVFVLVLLGIIQWVIASGAAVR